MCICMNCYSISNYYIKNVREVGYFKYGRAKQFIYSAKC